MAAPRRLIGVLVRDTLVPRLFTSLARILATTCSLIAIGAPAAAQPQIASRVVPAANAAGWHDAPATVEFRCRDVEACPAPVLVDGSGRQRIAVAGIRHDGTSLPAVVDVAIDLEAPTVALRPLPVRTERDVIQVGATIIDALSGVARASCNGTPARIDGQSLTCDVQLVPGDNAVVVQATDRAGNSGSAGVLVARVGRPAMLRAVPRTLTLLVGQEATFQVVDEFGIPHPDAIVAVDDRAVVEVVRQGRVAARGPGEAAVELSWRGLRAPASVTVVAGERLPMNTTRWSVPAVSGAKMLEVIYTHEVAGLESLLLTREAHGRIVAAALGGGETPVIEWLHVPAIAPDERIVQTMGETFGGGLLRVESEARGDAIVRIGRPDRDGGVPLWRLEASGRFGRMVQNREGTVFVPDWVDGGFPRMLVIDGRTGRVTARVPLPRSARVSRDCQSPGWPQEAPASFGDLFIPDGNALTIEVATIADDPGALACRAPLTQTRLRIALLAIDGHGATRTTELDDLVVAGGQPLPSVELSYVVPDARGGTLAPYTVASPGGRREHRVVRLEDDSRRLYTLPILGEFVVIDAVQPIYVQSGGSIAAFDPGSGTVAWHRRVSQGPVKILAGRLGGTGIIAQGDGHWIQLDLSGKRAEPDIPLPRSTPTPP